MTLQRRVLAPAGRISLLWILACAGCAPDESDWTPLFNGRDLDGWTPKITGLALGEDPLGTFRVEDGLLIVGYEGYEDFSDRFGHLFHETPFSDFRLRVEYRVVGTQAPGGPDWAFRNSGVMLHAQAPETMGLDQDFPISLEVQFLGGNGADPRTTANLCTPGTHVHVDGTLVERHCIESTSATYHGDEWVTVEAVVRGDAEFIHIVNGDTVLAYGQAVVGGGVVHGFDPEMKPDGSALSRGYIALQSESHPIQFRRVEIQSLIPPP